MSTTAGSSTVDFSRLQQALQKPLNDHERFQAIVNAPFDQKLPMAFMFLGIIVLLLVNKQSGTIDRVALSNTELAKRTTDVTVVPFEEIRIPVGTKKNVIAEAIRTGIPQDTTDWEFLFHPVLTTAEARVNQANAGISYSAVHPLKARDGGALIFSYFQYGQGVGREQDEFMTHYAKLVAKSLKN